MFENKDTRTELSKLGEFGLINHLTKDIKIKNSSTIKGVGDDAAVIDSGDKQTLITNDLLVENVHFDLVYYPLKHLGYKSAVVNFSDIVAMNGTPKQLIIGISLSNKFSLEAIEDFYAGLLLACKNYNVDLIGGDTTSSNKGLFISITVIGEANKDEIVYRNTAKEGNLICVSGNLGAAYTGLLILEREKHVFKADPSMQPELEGYDYILERQLKPEARNDIIKLLKDANIKPTSMIDISDGLASEIMHICTSSKVGCNLYDEKIPIDTTTYNTAREFSLDPTTCAMNGGEDYELLFTAELSDFDKIKSLKDVSVIGHITHKNSGMNLIAKNNVSVPIEAQGWDALRKDL